MVKKEGKCGEVPEESYIGYILRLFRQLDKSNCFWGCEKVMFSSHLFTFYKSPAYIFLQIAFQKT